MSESQHDAVQRTQSQLEEMNLANAPVGDHTMHGTQVDVQAPAQGREPDENAETNPGELLSVPASFEHQTMIDGLSSRDLIKQVGERLITMNNMLRAAAADPSRSASPHVSFRERAPVRDAPHVNKQWLNTVLAFAKDRKYDGLSLVPQTHDQKTRFATYKYNVGAAIRLCQGPKNDLASVHLVEDQCAVLLCEGSALQCVIDFAEKHDRDPSKAELFALLESQLLGSISGDLTVCKKLDVLHCDDLARILKSRMTKGTVSVDLASILNLAASELRLRPVIMDSASHVLWILSLFRDLTGGKNVNEDLKLIRSNAERCMKGGVWVEQMNPVDMLKQVASCAIPWDNYFQQHLSLSGGGSGSGVSGAQSSKGERPAKRTFAAVLEQKVQGATRQNLFDPFVSIPNQCVVDRSDSCKKWFIRGQTRVEMDSLMKAGKCVLCKQSGHLLSACSTRQAMFSNKKFCFHPTKM